MIMQSYRSTIYSVFNILDKLSEICIIVNELFWIKLKKDLMMITFSPCEGLYDMYGLTHIKGLTNTDW